MAKNKNRREQAPKNGRNEEWMRARLDHSNRNLTVPNKRKQYKRKEKYGVRWE